MVWSRLLTSFDPDEETANFGTRFAFESQEKLFDVVTQATIHAESPGTPFPAHIRSLSSGEDLYFSLGSSLHLLRGSSAEESLSVSLSESISYLSCSPCGHFLVLGLPRDCRFLHLPTGTLIPPINLESLNSDIIYANWGEKSLHLVTRDSQLVSIHGLDWSLLHTALLASDMEALQDLQRDILIGKPIPLPGSFKGALQEHGLFHSEDTLTKVDLNHPELPSLQTLRLPHIQIARICASQADPHVLFLLDEVSGALHMLCPLTLVLLRSWTEEPLEDMVLLEESSEEAELQLILITRRGSLQIRGFPSFELIYELKVHDFSRLMQTCSNQETPYFLEGSEKGTDFCLRVRGIVEASPEARLGRLLRRNKFEEALAFARTFHLSFEEVYKAKIVWLLEKLSPWTHNSPEVVEKYFQELKEAMSELKDKDFVVQTCIKAALPSIKSTKAILIHAREMIKDNLSEFPVDLLVYVSQVLQKIDTFHLLGKSDVEEWISFVEGNSHDILLRHIKRKELSEAKLIWIRHLAEFTLMFDAESITEILEEFRSYDEESILDWCDVFIPDCLRLVPESLPLLSEWAYSIVLSMESRRGWPLSGLTFAEKVLKKMTFGSQDECTAETQLVLFQQRSTASSSLNNFIKLIYLLKDLLVLHNNYRLKIKLENFMEAQKSKVVGTLLDWTSPEEVPGLISGYLNEYLRRDSGLNSSDIYGDYLLDLIENTSATWHWNAGEAPWEEKVSALIPFIPSVEKRAVVILKSLKAAPVPWSKVMTDLCTLGSVLPNASFSVAIKEQETLVSLKQILKRYNFRSKEINNKVQAEKMMKIILRKSGGSKEGFRDICEISTVMSFLEAEDASLAYIRYLLQNNSECPMKEVTDLVNEENREFLCRKILSYARTIKRIAFCELELQNCISFLGFAITDSTSSSIRLSFENLKQSFEASKKKRKSPKDFSDDGLREFISSNRSNGLSDLVNRLTGIASISGCNISKLLSLIFEELMTKGSMEDMDSLIDILCLKSFTNEGASFIQLIIDVCDISRRSNTEVISRLATLLARNLAKDDFNSLDLCEISIWLRAMLSFLATMNKSPFPYNIHSALYKDKGLPLTPDTLKAFIETLRTLFPVRDPYLNTRYKPSCVLFQSKESQSSSDDTFVFFDANNLKSKGNESKVFEPQEALDDLLPQMRTAVSAAKKNAQSSLSVMVYTRYKINFHLLESLMSKEATSLDSSSQKAIIASLFNNILDERKKELDHILGLACLLNEPSGMDILAGIKTSFSSDFSRLPALARIGYNYAYLGGQTSLTNKYKGTLQNILWAKRLVELGVNPKDAFVSSAIDKERVLTKLVKVDSLNIQDLLHFASAFDFEGDEVLVAYAKEQISRNSGTNLSEIINSISCPSKAGAMLHKMWNIVGSYNYETLDVIIRGIQSMSSPNARITKAADILEFLKCYERVNGPSELERTNWTEKYKSEFKKFPSELADKRLPLTPLITLTKKERYNLLEQEFQLSNCYLWVNVADLISLIPDNICITAVENAIKDILRTAPSSDNCVESKYEKILEKVFDCLGSMEDFFKATSTAFWVLDKLPRGKDKVNASRAYRRIAQKWKEESQGTPEEAQSLKALNFAIEDQLRVETEFALVKYGLDEQIYMDMVSEKSTESLLLSLYEHDSIIERSKTAGGFYPDINGAVDEIAQIQNLHIVSLKYEMLTNWLPENKDLNYLDESLSLDIHQGSRAKDSNEEKDNNNYIRCVYISQCSELHNFLINIALGRTSADVHSTSHKLRALRCLLSVVDESSLCRMAHMNYKEIQGLFSNLVFVHKLESLGLHYDLETYISCDKKILIESVIRSSGVTKEGLSLIIDLSMFFSIYDSLLWNDLLGRLVQYSSSSRLETVLLKLNHQPHLWHLDNFLRAWNHLLLQPFLSNESHEECTKALTLLNKCPLHLDITELKGECTRLGFNDLVEKLSKCYL